MALDEVIVLYCEQNFSVLGILWEKFEGELLVQFFDDIEADKSCKGIRIHLPLISVVLLCDSSGNLPIPGFLFLTDSAGKRSQHLLDVLVRCLPGGFFFKISISLFSFSGDEANIFSNLFLL